MHICVWMCVWVCVCVCVFVSAVHFRPLLVEVVAFLQQTKQHLQRNNPPCLIQSAWRRLKH